MLSIISSISLKVSLSIICLSSWIGWQSIFGISLPTIFLPGNINPSHDQQISSLSTKSKSPATSIFLPANTPFLAVLLTPPEDLAKLGKATISPRWSKEFTKSLNNLWQELNINYQQQIQSWLGTEISFAITTPDLDRDPRNGQQLGWLLALTSNDREATVNFVSSFWQEKANQNIPINYQAYRGVQIISQNQSDYSVDYIKNKSHKSASHKSASQGKYPHLSMALVGDKFLLIANHAEVLKSAIAHVEPPLENLPKTANFQRAIAQAENPLGLLWINLADWVFSVGEQQVITWPQIAIALQEEAGNITTPTLFFQENLPAQPALLETPIESLKLIPADSTFVAASRNFSQFWQNVTTLSSNNSPFGGFLAPLVKQIQTDWGIDFTADIDPPITGEYILALLPDQTNDQPDWLFIVKDYPEIGELLSHFDAIATNQGFSTGKFTLDDHNIQAWTELNAKSQKNLVNNHKNSRNDQEHLSLVTTNIKALHTTLNINQGQYEIFANSLPTLQKVWEVDSKTNFFHSNKFEQINNNLPAPNNGYLYINWPANQTLFTEKIPVLNLLVKSSKLIFPELRSLTISNFASEAGVSKNNIFWNYHLSTLQHIPA